MYRGRPWTIRQYAGYGSAEETNARFRYLLERGQTGLSVAFDLPTQLGYDSDDPLAEGEVGRTGVAIDSIADMEVLLDGIPLGEVSTSMTINAPAALLLLLYELVAEGRACAATKLRGTVQNDVLKEYVARGNYIFPPRPSMRLTTDLFAYCAERLPRWNTISISGYHIREAGSSAAQELAFTLANGIAYCEAAVAAGLSPDDVRRAALLLLQRAQPLLPGGREVPRGAAAVGADHARALRRDEPARDRAPLPRADRRLDADRAAAGDRTSCASRSRRSRRSAAARSRCTRTRSTRRSRCRPSTPRGSRSARSRSSRTRPATTDTADPLGGAYFIEALTDELEARARELIERVDELGGAVAAIEQGFVQGEIEASAFRYQAEVEAGERVVVGVNRFAEDDDEHVELLQVDPEGERRQRERTARVRAERDAAAADGRARRGARASPRPTRTCCRRSARRSARAARSARSAAFCASCGGRMTPSTGRAPRRRVALVVRARRARWSSRSRPATRRRRRSGPALAPSFTRDVAPIIRRSARAATRSAASRRSRSTTAAQIGRARGLDRGRGAGRRHAAVAARAAARRRTSARQERKLTATRARDDPRLGTTPAARVDGPALGSRAPTDARPSRRASRAPRLRMPAAYTPQAPGGHDRRLPLLPPRPEARAATRPSPRPHRARAARRSSTT